MLRKVSLSGISNSETFGIAGEKCKTGVDKMSRKRSLPSINVATFEKLQQEDPAQSIENYLCSVDSNLDVGISFNGITRKSKKQVEKGLTYSFQVLFEKRTRLLSRFQRILIANITVNLMSLSR